MKYIAMLSLMLLPEVGFTSQEGVLAIASFQIESAGIGSSGPVSVQGRRNSKGEFESLSVTAFGKTFAVEKRLLEKIPAGANGIQLTYEHGYPTLGGRTVYLTFLKGFASGTKDKVVLSINEQGKSSWVP